MSQTLDPLLFPLHGSRLIEASAGTGKTWTIAALYVRLVLGHGDASGFVRPLMPSEILVMTFTRAATRELGQRVRQRLVEAAAFFRDPAPGADSFLEALAVSYPDPATRKRAAHRLALAAETMDEAAIFTIDSWCQRMLREHAFDSGCMFDEELVSDETDLLHDAVNDYWREHVYRLDASALDQVLDCWADPAVLRRKVKGLIERAALLEVSTDEPLGDALVRAQRERRQRLAELKAPCVALADEVQDWVAAQLQDKVKRFNGSKLQNGRVGTWCEALRTWAQDPQLEELKLGGGWDRLSSAGIRDALKDGYSIDPPPVFEALSTLKAALDGLAPVAAGLLAHAACWISQRVQQLKQRQRQAGFADMLARLKSALEHEHGAALRERIVQQYPVALVDEFQDTSPDQYRIFDLLYRVVDNDGQLGLFLIGDPKQSIYGFRGADIHSYLAARRATETRHYKLGTNYRSVPELVEAVNQLFLHAEGSADQPNFPRGAFGFRRGNDNPLPFEAVAAGAQRAQLVGLKASERALSFYISSGEKFNRDKYRPFFAHHCAEHIVGLLNDPAAGFQDGQGFRRLLPADIAILVRDRNEAKAVRDALMRRNVASVYLSDKDSVINSDEAADVLRWLQAVANPLDGTLARAAFATGTAALGLGELAQLASDELAWDARVLQLKQLNTCWQRQGVLAMLRRFIHELDLPARLLRETGGERRLTNLLHLAELLQQASTQTDGEQALCRWLAEQIEAEEAAGDERVLRLESDAELVKVVTVHKSKGLEYPLVYLPFAASARPVSTSRSGFFEYVDEQGRRHLDLGKGAAALREVERARLEEEVRLFYVAVTRARHFLWLGAVSVAGGDDKLHETALGYLIGGGAQIAPDQLEGQLHGLRANLDSIAVQELPEAEGLTLLAREDARPPLRPAPHYEAHFERRWRIGSFTSLARHMQAAPMRAQEQTLFEEAPETVVPARIEDAPWHRFPRGSVPGNFMHEQLEWLAQEGFDCLIDPACVQRLERRIERAGWGHRQEDAIAWLRQIVSTTLPPLGAPLAALNGVLPEMEFWFPSPALNVSALARVCGEHLLGQVARPVLPASTLQGMLKGFADLVFEHEGKYWVLDYKSNALGPNDAAYTTAAMAQGMAEHRYDIQGAIYMLALHRLLRARLGPAYQGAGQLGGAIFLFLRGIGNADTRGCYTLAPDMAMLDQLERLLDENEG